MSKNTRTWSSSLLNRTLAAYESGTARDVAVALTSALPAILQHADTSVPGRPAHALKASIESYITLKERLGRKTLERLYAEQYAAAPAAFVWSPDLGFEHVPHIPQQKPVLAKAAVSMHDLLVILNEELAQPLPYGFAVVAWNEDPPRVLAAARTLIACVRQMNAGDPLYRVTADRLMQSEDLAVESCSRSYLEQHDHLIRGQIGKLLVTEAEMLEYTSALAATSVVRRKLMVRP